MKEYIKDYTSMTRKLLNPRGLLQMADNRVFAKQQADIISSATNKSKNPIQRKTEIAYTPGTIRYWTGGLGHSTQSVGIKMEAYLDPKDPQTGSRTGMGTGIYYNRHYNDIIQGHLLNANLGGQAISANLFPITSELNKIHSTTVEDNVKQKFINLYNDVQVGKNQNRRLYYSVEVCNPNFQNITPTTIKDTQLKIKSKFTLDELDSQRLSSTMWGGEIMLSAQNLNDQLANIGFAPNNSRNYTLDLTTYQDSFGRNFRHLKDSSGNICDSYRVYI